VVAAAETAVETAARIVTICVVLTVEFHLAEMCA
jgi:hypothetical protein